MAPSAMLLCQVLLLPLVAGFIDVPDGPVDGPPLRVGSFNIQIFGQAKMGHPEVVDVLVKILSRYDVVQVLEIRDYKQTAFEHLRQDLNAYITRTGSSDHYEKVESARLGRTSSQEQYGFLYRPSRVNVTGTYQFDDTKADVFEREPFGVRFSSPTTVVTDFALVAIHIKPSQAVEEMDNLTKAYDAFQQHWNISYIIIGGDFNVASSYFSIAASSSLNIIIGGDFNADCSYLSPNDWARVSLHKDVRFTWLVNETLDTNLAHSFCTYDRFVLGGTALPAAVVPGSVKAYRFDDTMHLTYTQARHVSDHFPIEFELKGAPLVTT